MRHLQVPSDERLWANIRQSVAGTQRMAPSRFYGLLVAKMILFGGISIGAYAGIWRSGRPSALVVSYLVFGFSMILLALNFAHDLAHHTVFRDKQWNNRLSLVIFGMLGADGAAWKQRHVQAHHHAPNVHNLDPDLQLSDWIRVSTHTPWRPAHRWQHWYALLAYSVYSLFWIFVKDMAVWRQNPGKTLRSGLVFGGWKAIYVLYLLVLPAIFSPVGAIWVVFGFLVMHLVQSVFLLLTFLITHHVAGLYYPATTPDGAIQSSWLMNQVRSSNDFYPFSRVANFIFGGFNNHIAHHLFPGVHHLYYPQISRVVYEILQKNGIYPAHTSYWGGVRAHLNLLQQFSKP
jgi:linoleoyl-CoA desaturase